MRGVEFPVQSSFRRFVGAAAFEDRPWLVKLGCEFQNAVDLVAAREGSSIKEDCLSWIALQQVASGVEHDFHDKVILLDGVFDIARREKSGADFVLAQD